MTIIVTMNTFCLVYFVKAKLDGHRHERLKRKLPAETQWLNAIEEDKGVKKKLIEMIETSEKQASDNFSKITDTLDRLTTSIADGFNLLRQVVHTPPPPPHYNMPFDGRSLYGQIYAHTPPPVIFPKFSTSSALSPTQLIS